MRVVNLTLIRRVRKIIVKRIIGDRVVVKEEEVVITAKFLRPILILFLALINLQLAGNIIIKRKTFNFYI